MKSITLAIFAVGVLLVASSVSASSEGITLIYRHGNIEKFYDYDNDVVCYTLDTGYTNPSVSISCLKNSHD